MKFLSIIGMAFMLLTSSFAAAEQLTLGDVQGYCWKTSYGRDVGKLRDTCGQGLEKNMSWCYKPCKPGYESNGMGGCNQKCKPGSRDDGLFCRYVEQHVDEFVWQFGDPAFQNTGQMRRCRASSKGRAYGCEQNGWLVITKCPPGQEHILGFCRTKNLNCKSLGYAGQFDLSCTKYTYSRTPQDAGCAGGLEDDAGLCYKKCDSGFYGVGPVCWSSCPTVKGKKWVACGAGCAKDDATCGLVTTDQIVSSLDMAFSIASTLVTAGAASPLSLSAKVAGRKMLQQTKNLQKVYDVTGKLVGGGMTGAAWLGNVSNSSTMDQEAQAWLIAQTSLDVAAMADPTGVAGVVNSFTKPLCSRIGTKPKPDESAAGLESVMSSEKNYVKFLEDSLKFARAFQNNLHGLRGQALIETRRIEAEEKQVADYKKKWGKLMDDRYRMTQWYPSNTDKGSKIFDPAYNGKRYLWGVSKLNYTQAAAYCKQHNAHLAEPWELQEANNNGYSRCAAGWLAGGKAGYVMVGTHKGCGKDGFNGWSSSNKAATLGAYCVGPKLPADVAANSARLIEKGWKEHNLANYDKLLTDADKLVKRAERGEFYTKAGKAKVARYQKRAKDLQAAWENSGKTVYKFEQKLKNAKRDYKRLVELKNDSSKLVLWGVDSGNNHAKGKTYKQAQEYCISKGGFLATKQHMTIAQEAGFEMCSSGWLGDGSTGHVMQQARSGCGKAGFNKGDTHLKTKGDAEKHKNLKRGTYCVASKAPAGAKGIKLALTYYYLTNKFLGDNKVMTLDGKNRLVMSTKAANNDRQKWRVREGENGWYRLYNKALGADMSVDSGKDKPHMGNTGSYTGQAWRFTPVAGGWYRLSNSYQGENKVLDTYNATGNHLFLENKAKNTTGSFWKKVNVNGVTAPRVSSTTRAVTPKNNPLYKASASSGSNPLYKASSAPVVTAAITLNNGATYLFNTDGTYSKYSKGRTSIDKGYPAKMPGGWQGLPSTWRSDIDAATPYEGSKKAYMFKGGKYVRLNGVKVDRGYPANMPGGWQGVPKGWRGDVDAAFYYAPGKKHYFFKGDEYIGVKGVKADRSKPSKLPGGWVGMPAEFVAGIDAATFRAGHVYMFKGDKYIRFTGTKMDSGYPKPIKGNWPR